MISQLLIDPWVSKVAAGVTIATLVGIFRHNRIMRDKVVKKEDVPTYISAAIQDNKLITEDDCGKCDSKGVVPTIMKAMEKMEARINSKIDESKQWTKDVHGEVRELRKQFVNHIDKPRS